MRTATRSPKRRGIYGIAPMRCRCGEVCDLCALDVFSGSGPSTKKIQITLLNWSSTSPCTPSGGLGAGPLLGSAASPLTHEVAYSHEQPNGCPVYYLSIKGTAFNETGDITVIIGPNTTTCGSADCSIILTYNPGARLQRIYKYDADAWTSCHTQKHSLCEGSRWYRWYHVGNTIGGIVMNCPLQRINSDGTMECTIRRGFGQFRLAGPGNPNYPCDQCRAQWKDGTPPVLEDRSTWTPTILSMTNLPATNRGALPLYARGGKRSFRHAAFAAESTPATRPNAPVEPKRRSTIVDPATPSRPKTILSVSVCRRAFHHFIR